MNTTAAMLHCVFPEGSQRKELVKRWLFEPKVPRRLSERFIHLDHRQLDRVADSLRQHFFSQSPAGWLETEAGQRDLHDHLLGRLLDDRRRRIPWLDAAQPLAGARVLEIGCGTGCSTVALAEQGARVTAADIDTCALASAKARCATYGVQAEFLECNATEVAGRLAGRTFDMVIFWACLEHLTLDERLVSMRATWDLLPPGGLWCVTGSPNRLWPDDFHTSLMPFFMWLPDPLAIRCAAFSPRGRFREAFAGGGSDTGEDLDTRLARWGRGVSFHEFALTLGDPNALDIVSSMDRYHRRQRLLARAKWAWSRRGRYVRALECFGGELHRGFYEANLNLIIRKPVAPPGRSQAARAAADAP